MFPHRVWSCAHLLLAMCPQVLRSSRNLIVIQSCPIPAPGFDLSTNNTRHRQKLGCMRCLQPAKLSIVQYRLP
ncbi:hypothetical protein RSAG8_10084, partial [Rhizoctonia solani AG-8 WAC10335]